MKLIFFSFFLILCSCQISSPGPYLNEIYATQAKYHGPSRNPVILIPGIMGSQLVDKEGQIAWGNYLGLSSNPYKNKELYQKLIYKKENNELTPSKTLDRFQLNLLGFNVQQKAYTNLLKLLGIGGYKDQSFSPPGIDYSDEHFTCFQFAYDWRQGNEISAQKLHDFIENKKKELTKIYKEKYKIENPKIKFDIVSHSMGGLVALYYYKYKDTPLLETQKYETAPMLGAENIDNLVFIGTPFMGSTEAFTNLLDGKSFGWFLPTYDPILLSTYSSLYQLLPKYSFLIDKNSKEINLDIFSVQSWQQMKWGIFQESYPKYNADIFGSNNNADYKKNFLQEKLEQAKIFNSAISKKNAFLSSSKIYIFAGDSEATKSLAIIDPLARKPLSYIYDYGDNTVLRGSAVGNKDIYFENNLKMSPFIENAATQIYFESHLGLTSDQQFADNLLFILLQK